MNDESVQMNLYNKATTYTNCTVEIWENTITGEVSWGWCRTDETEVIEGE